MAAFDGYWEEIWFPSNHKAPNFINLKKLDPFRGQDHSSAET